MSTSAFPAEMQTRPNEPTAIFHHASIKIAALNLHYVEVGTGDPVVLLPGWPEDWTAWRKVAVRLAGAGRRVIIPEPRGFGQSDKPLNGYDLDTVAEDVHLFLQQIRLTQAGPVDFVTHDVGSWIGYALASTHPGDVRSLILSEVSLPKPGTHDNVTTDEQNIQSWHHDFNRLPDLPEALITRHERIFLDWLFDHKALRRWMIDDAARQAYAENLSSPGTARAGFAYYRALFSPAGLQRMGERLASPLPMPVLAIGGSGGVGDALHRGLESSVTRLSSAVLEGCGHYLPEECPDSFAQAVERFWADEQPKSRSGVAHEPG